MNVLQQSLAEQEQIRISPLEWLMDIDHTFSHIRWQMKVYRATMGDINRQREGGDWVPFHYRWVGPDELEQYAFPNVFIRIMNQHVI